MDRPHRIQEVLYRELEANHVEVIDDSVAHAGHLGAGRAGQFLEFVERIRTGKPEFGVQDNGAVTALGSVNQAGSALRGLWLQPSSSSKTRTFRAGTTVEMACL